MPEFYEAMFFIVRKMAAVKNRPGGYELLTEKGGRLGEIEASVRGGLGRLLIEGGIGLPRRINVTDLQGRTIVDIRKPFGLKSFSAQILGADGKPMGRVRMGRRAMGMAGQRLEVQDASGKPLGSLVGDWRAWNVQLFDDNGGLLGKIARKAENVNRVIYADVDHYQVELSKPVTGELRRRLLLSVAASLGLLMS
ncbi:MAG: hypothetical protein FJX76_08375 [Armatimonadetes bacterium]|nr:hypothetical protein [Armatimonadota bacterium]